MRLLITTDTVGGVWTFTQELAAGLLECKCDVLLVSFGRMPSDAQQAQCDALCRRFGRHFHYVASDVPLEWMDDNHDAFTAGALVLEREAAAFAPDVIHSNQFCYGAVDLGVPTVVTAHSDVLSWARACRTEPLPPTEWLRSYVHQVQAGLTMTHAVTAPTRWMLDALAETFVLPEQREVISNGRALRSHGDGERDLRAVTAGRLWDEAKGIAILADVHTRVPIVIAGETELGSARAQQSLGHARMLGQLSELELLELMRESSIYLCTSVYEPFGLAALEAARCGCAVVARDIPSLREVWQDCALYFTNAAELSALLEQLADDRNLLNQARRNSCEQSVLYSRERMVQNYLRLFEQVQAQTARLENAA